MPTDPEELWFRGDSRVYALQPGIYRNEARVYEGDEENLLERFIQLSTPLKPAHVADSWDWYFLAQHHGIPTRLLDWTESLMVAMYFSLKGSVEAPTRAKFDQARLQKPGRSRFGPKSPCIWVLDAGSMNSAAHGADNDCIFTLGGAVTRGYAIEGVATKTDENRYPIAIMPPYANTRLIAQQGRFTLHGHERISIEKLAQTRPIRVACILLDQARVPWMWRELERLGISRASLFPDLDSFAFVTKWFSQHPVTAKAGKRSAAVSSKRRGGPKKRVSRTKPRPKRKSTR